MYFIKCQGGASKWNAGCYTSSRQIQWPENLFLCECVFEYYTTIYYINNHRDSASITLTSGPSFEDYLWCVRNYSSRCGVIAANPNLTWDSQVWVGQTESEHLFTIPTSNTGLVVATGIREHLKRRELASQSSSLSSSALWCLCFFPWLSSYHIQI